MSTAVPIYQVDSFTDHPFGGNPAGVCFLDEPAEAAWMQSVAAEMNLAETAFLSPQADGYDLRWFTPLVEVEMCGHATLASAHVLWETGRLSRVAEARFHTLSGLLTASLRDGLIEMDFPATPSQPAEPPAGLLEALRTEATYVGRTRFDVLLELASEETVRALAPDFGALRTVQARGVIVTARATTAPYDIVSRFFAPPVGIDEDPVTGSAHAALCPYWARKLGKDRLTAYQASARGGILHLRLAGERVKIAGQAVMVLAGDLVV